MADMSNDKEREALMDLIDAYAEARHVGGCHTYNAKTAEARAKVVASLAASAGSEPVAWRLRNTAFRSEVYEYFRTQYLAECRQKQFNASVDDGGLHDLTPLYTHPSPPEGAGWRPIAEAPKDDTVVDIWRPSWGGERCPDMRRVDLGGGNVFYAPVLAGPACVRDATHFMIVRPPLAAGGGREAG